MADPRPGITPTITRTNSVIPSNASIGPVGNDTIDRGNSNPPVPERPNRNTVYFVPRPSGGAVTHNNSYYVPDGAVLVRASSGGVYVRFPNAPTTAELAQMEANSRAISEPIRIAQQRAADEARGQRVQADYRGQAARTVAANQATLNGAGLATQEAIRPGAATDRFGAFDEATGTRTLNTGQTDTSSYGARVAANQQRAQSVFSALNGDSVDGTAQFLLSNGEAIDPTTGSNNNRSGTQDLRVGGRNASQNAKRPTQNLMTIAAGAQWFRRLSVEDPTAYNQLVVQLRNAGYGNLPDKDELLPLNRYSTAAEGAFTQAVADMSVARNEGDNSTLVEWLTRAGQGYVDYVAQQAAEDAAANAEPEYQPVDRSYTDPAAVKAQAKQAAIAALGRRLTEEEEARFEASFRGKEDGYYDAIDAAGRAKTAARVADPNVSAQADAFVDDPKYDTERAGQAIGNYAQAFQRMMGVGG